MPPACVGRSEGLVCCVDGCAGASIGAAVSAGAVDSDGAADGEPDAAASGADCAKAKPVAANSATVPIASPDVRRFIVHSSWVLPHERVTPRGLDRMSAKIGASHPAHAGTRQSPVVNARHAREFLALKPCLHSDKNLPRCEHNPGTAAPIQQIPPPVAQRFESTAFYEISARRSMTGPDRYRCGSPAGVRPA